MASLPAAYPYVSVTIDESGLIPVAQRSPGVVAIVGQAVAGGADIATAPANTPLVVDTPADLTQFAQMTGTTVTASTALRDSLFLVMNQNPRPSKIYAVRTVKGDYATALQALEAADDVDFVSLANEIDPAALGALKAHVENISAAGSKRMGFAMIDPTRAKSATYVNDVAAATNALKSSSGRMVVMAARGATGDVASAAMGAIAGYAPQVSAVLKPIGGVTIPQVSQYSPSEITGLSQLGINPVISPSLLVGGGFYFADGRTFSSDAALQFIDIVRVLDDLDFKLKAGLIGTVGDDRITKGGLTLLLTRTEGILDPCVSSAEIDDYTIDIPLLDILVRPESTWSAGEIATVANARAVRQVPVSVKVVYGPAVHQIQVTLAPSFS